MELNFYPIDLPPSNSKTDGLSPTATPATNTPYVAVPETKGATVGLDLKDSNKSVVLLDEDIINYLNFEAFENMTAGDFAKITNDNGTPKLAKVFGYSDEATVTSVATTSGYDPYVHKIIKLSDNKVAIYYSTTRDAGGTVRRQIRLIIGTLSNKTWTWGSSVQLYEGNETNGGTNISFIDACLVTTDTTMCILLENVTTNPAGSRQFTISYTSEISGTTVSNSYSEDWGWGQADGDGTDTVPASCVQISDGKVVVTANISADTDYSAKCGTWNGTTNTWTIGTIFDINTTNNGAGAGSWKLDTDRFFSIYNTTNVRIMTVSGTTISSVATDTLAGTNGYQFAITGASTGVYSYNDGGALTICSFTEVAGVITEANTTVIDASLTANRGLDIRIGTLDFYLTWDDIITVARLISGTGFTFATAGSITSNGIDVLCVVDDNKFITCDCGASAITCVTGDFDMGEVLGTVRNTVYAGEVALLQPNGVINQGQTGLIVGNIYYINSQGELTTSTSETINGVSWTNKKVGTAMATTKILINIS